jgi:tetratricopeptide (TPR) repeat protein
MSSLEVVKQLLARNALAEAEVLLWALLREGDGRSHEAWLRLGEIHAARGHLRRAVGAFRRAMELDARGEHSFVLHQAISTLGQVLHRQRKPFLHPSDETVRNRHLLAGQPFVAPTVEAVRAALEALAPSVPASGRAALTSAITFLARGALDESVSEQSPARELEQHGGDAARDLALEVRAVHLAWYDAMLAREESVPG